MNNVEFFNLCKRHDWYYNMSDDYRYWTAGTAERAKIKAILAEDSSLQPIFDAWYNNKFNNGAMPVLEELC